DIRYYDQVLTDAVRAYLIDPSDRTAYDLYYATAPLLDQALLEAQSLSTSEEARRIFERINQVNTELVAIEKELLANPDLEIGRALLAGTYGELKAAYSNNVLEFYDLERAELEATNAAILAQVSSVVTIVLLAGVVLLAASVGITVILSRSILIPLRALIGTTEEVAQGNLDAQLPPTTRDELGDLTRSFGAMVTRIRETLSVVEARSRDLQTVADVNAQISTILDVERLLQDVVDLTKERFRLYHSHIYMVNESGDTLELTSGAGHVGRQMVAEVRTIALDNPQSIVARSASTRKPVTVQDVRQSATFLPHPLLPDTRSELAVPLSARGQVLGVLDVQSDTPDYFTAEAVGVIELMADQIATALSNARLYEIAERSSRHERALGSIDRHIQGAADVDEILQVAVRELGKALRVPHTAIELRMNSEPDANSELDYQAN
ncbi:MAG: GAF domain-containing protein, partial [Acidobacteriales bacterium]|nr:GAF domain-containing protein [Terriglobales bacterium]